MSASKSKTIKSTGSHIPQSRKIRATFHKDVNYPMEKMSLFSAPHNPSPVWNIL